MAYFRLDGFTDVTGRSTDSANTGPLIGGETEQQRSDRLIDYAIAKVFPAETAPSDTHGPRGRLDSRSDEAARGPDPAAARAAMIKRNAEAWRGPAQPVQENVRLDAQDDPNNPDPDAARARMLERNANAWRR